MQIAEARAYRQWQPFHDGRYACSGGVADGFDSTIVALEGEDGTTGYGEAAPLGAFYAPAFPAGVRAGVAELLPLVIGADATAPPALLRRLDTAMLGQPAAKSALDMAACDLAARLAGVALCEALGGRDGETVALYRSVISDAPDAMAERARGYVRDGYQRIQVKVGADPVADAERLHAVRDAVGHAVALVCDANGSWGTAAALRFLQATRELDYVLEQPCATLAECALVRARCERPLALDESVVDLDSLLAARQVAGLRCGDDQACTRRRHHARGAAARCRLRARPARDGRGHGRQRHRHRRDGPCVPLDAGRTAPAHRRLQRVGHRLERRRHAGARIGGAGRACRDRARRDGSHRRSRRAVRGGYCCIRAALSSGLGGDSSSGEHDARRSTPSASS